MKPTNEQLVIFLKEAAKYFENRETYCEDKAHWANIYNAKNCRDAAERIENLEKKVLNLENTHDKILKEIMGNQLLHKHMDEIKEPYDD